MRGQRGATIVGDGCGFPALDRGRGLDEQVAQERALRRAPRRRTGGAGVADREQVQEAEPFGVARARRGEVVGDARVGEIAPRRDLGHQQVVAHEPGDDLAPFAVEPDAPHHAERDVGADLRVVTGKSLADVVEERTEQQELRTPAGARDDAVEPGVAGLAGVEQRGALRERFEQVPIDGEAVVRVALRTGPHVLPLGQESNEDAFVVECLEHGDGTGAGPQQPQERGALPHVPRRLGHRSQPGQRGPLERQRPPRPRRPTPPARATPRPVARR